MVQEETGIERLADLRDVTLALNAINAFSAWLQARAPLEGVRSVPYTVGFAPSLLCKRYAQQAYSFSEPYIAGREGARVRNLMLADIDFNPYTSLLVTTRGRLEGRAEEVGAVARAAAAGWREYLRDPEPANRLIHAANPEMS